VLIFAVSCVGVVLFLYYPGRALLIAAVLFLFSLFLWFLTMRPVPEPDRALVYRLALLDHVAGPGYIFLVPGFDHIEGTLDMGPHEKAIEVPQIRAADAQYVRTNLEATWRIHPGVQGRVSDKVRATILMDDAHREKLVEETVIQVARTVVNNYTAEDLRPAAVRENATLTMTEAANEILESYGLQVERIFWRGSPYPGKLSEAKLEGAVRLEEVETLISSVEAVRKRLPDLPPEELLALAAWLDMYRRGGVTGPTPPSPPKMSG
jgi:regulator of protease activity HflC (stomatin/prohibitin superfamily)